MNNSLRVKMDNEQLKEALERFKTGIFSEEDRSLIADFIQLFLDASKGMPEKKAPCSTYTYSDGRIDEFFKEEDLGFNEAIDQIRPYVSKLEMENKELENKIKIEQCPHCVISHGIGLNEKVSEILIECKYGEVHPDKNFIIRKELEGKK